MKLVLVSRWAMMVIGIQHRKFVVIGSNVALIDATSVFLELHEWDLLEPDACAHDLCHAEQP